MRERIPLRKEMAEDEINRDPRQPLRTLKYIGALDTQDDTNIENREGV